jgi:hypothetical protein
MHARLNSQNFALNGQSGSTNLSMTDAHSANFDEFTRELRTLTKAIDHLSVSHDWYEADIEGRINVRSRAKRNSRFLAVMFVPKLNEVRDRIVALEFQQLASFRHYVQADFTDFKD